MKQRILLLVLAIFSYTGIVRAEEPSGINPTIAYEYSNGKLTIDKAPSPKYGVFSAEEILIGDYIEISGQKKYIDTLVMNENPAIKKIYIKSTRLKAMICQNNSVLRDIVVHTNTSYINLTYLDFRDCRYLETINNIGNKITYLDLTGCSSIKRLTCAQNTGLEKLDLSTCSALETLQCSGCTGLKEITLPTNTAHLQNVEVDGCSQLKDLDLTGYSNLKNLSFTNCDNLTGLKLPETNNTSVKKLVFEKTPLDTIKVNNYLALDTFICNNSAKINHIVMSNNVSYIKCEKNTILNSLDISNCAKLAYLNISDSYNLDSIISVQVKKCRKMYWYVNAPGYLTGNWDVSKGYIKKDGYATLCWPEQLRLKEGDLEAYTIVGEYDQDNEEGGQDDCNLIHYIFLRKVTTKGASNTLQLSPGVPYIIKPKTDTFSFSRDYEINVETPVTEGTNGLVGTFTTSQKPWESLYFADGTIFYSAKQTDNQPNLELYAFTAYINRANVPAFVSGDTYDDYVSDGGKTSKADRIDFVKGNANDKVNVYTLQGVKVRNNVKAANATDGLPEGAYIVGGKVVVK